MPKLEVIDQETGEVSEVHQPIRFRSPMERKRVTKVFLNDARTQAHFQDECDINKLMAKYQKFGGFPDDDPAARKFGDFTQVGDYHSAMNAIVDAQERFARLPSSLRKRFSNDPALLLEFLSDPENRDEAVKLGLIVPEPPKPQAAPSGPVPEPPQGPSPADGNGSEEPS